jgi:alanine-glyoxylate transaminase/serine-glyoxylate transaminase/serine-pyruvate transaminase
VAPGLAPLTLSERAWERRVPTPQSWYLDLGLVGEYVGGQGGRKYHHTAPVAMVRSLHAGLGAVLEEGLEAVWARHAECGRLLHEGLVAMGLQLFAEEGHRLPELTSVVVPQGVDSAKVRAQLLDRFGIEIGGGVGAFASSTWRIGCMGHNARPANVVLLLAALAEVLGR